MMGKRVVRHDTVIRDPRFNPCRGDTVFLSEERLTVEFVNDISPMIQLVGFTFGMSGSKRVVDMSAWRDMCRDADGAVDPSAPIN
jgi:hypothetical protein